MSKQQRQNQAPRQKVKLVAEMPGDAEMRKNMREQQQNDGYPGSCGCDA
ncbi:hypothetical protein RAC89_22055 [Paenibacillus sp. GD4]|jgi:hypothetical protein|nr:MULTISPECIES: hypothetical protein [Paenibacillus]MDQ1913081.1 hypothetical protein [Paenibacillus sp. GD4]